jgi:bifunctional lysine-specific demethylase and histidyl-hydroxylase NO66
VTEPGLRHPAFRLVKAGEQIPVGSYTEDVAWRPVPFTGTADVRRVVDEFERGATIVLQGLHHSRPSLARYCRELEAALGHPAQANAYMTPRRSQGLPVHHDTHDVFVLQVAGRKRWLVYDPVFQLPLKHQRYDAEMGAPGETVLDIVVEPGNTLYLPRGWLHEALTSDEDSLHLTIGVNVVTWLDAFRAALERLEDDVEFRRSLPADGGGADDLLERLAARLDPDEVVTADRARRLAARRPVLDGLLSDLRALDDLGADTKLERRPTVLFELTEEDDGAITLAFEGRELRFPPHAGAEVQAIAASTEPFAATDLPGRLDEPGRLVLLRRLVREGFLRLKR